MGKIFYHRVKSQISLSGEQEEPILYKNLVAHAQTPLSHVHADVPCGTRDVQFGLGLHLHLGYEYSTSKGSDA